MNIILLQAPAKNLKFNIGGYFRVLPLGLAYLAESLRKNRLDFEIFYPKSPIGFFDSFEAFLAARVNEPLIIGIYATLFSAREALRLAAIAKKNNPGNIVILGGPITTFSADSIFRFSANVDYIISGEGEKAFSLLAQAINSNLPVSAIPNTALKSGSKIIFNKEEYEQDLDLLGMPLRSIFPDWSHHLHPPMGRYSPAYLVETMRGCSYKCAFCALPKAVRSRSINTVIGELETLVRDFGAKEVYFIDPTFTIDKQRANRLCEEILRRKVGLRWSCMTRVDCVDEELLEIMKAAGCYLIHFGVESATRDILIGMSKEQTLGDTIRAFDLCNRLDIRTGAFIVFASTRFDTEATVRESMSLMKRIRPTYVLYDHIKPIPNGPLVKQAIKEGIISDRDIEEFYLGDNSKSRLSYVTVSGIPRKTAVQWTSVASRSFYFSLGSFFRMAKTLNTMSDWSNFVKAGALFSREIFRSSDW